MCFDFLCYTYFIFTNLQQSEDSPLPNKSTFTIVVTPGAEKLAEDVSALRLKEGPDLSKSMVSLAQLVATLARQPHADRAVNYG